MTEKGIIRIRRAAAKLTEACDAMAQLSDPDCSELSEKIVIAGDMPPRWSELRTLANFLFKLTNEPPKQVPA